MKTIAVMNQKGGTGKTTSAINLAGELVRRGKKVLIVDMDTQGNATSNLLLTEVPPYTLTDVIVSKTAVLADTICHTSIENLDLIRGGGLLAPALAAMQEAFAYPMPFSFDTDISLTGTLTTGRMNPVQALLSDDDEATSFVKGYGGELLRDGFRVSVKAALGQDRGVSIRYGKNLVGLEVTEDESEVKTRIICYGKNGSVTLESPHLGDYIYPKIHTLTEENKSISEVQAEAQKLLDEGCDIPSINIKVDFVALEKTVEYREYAVLEEVFLGDMVTVINTKMGFRKQAKVISYEWDCLLEQYNEVELGDFIPTLAASVTSGVKSGSLASSAYINAASVMTLLQQHLNDFNNPHHVTAAQVQS